MMADAHTDRERPNNAQSGSKEGLMEGNVSLNGESPTKQEMWAVIQQQQEQIDGLQEQVAHLTDLIEEGDDALTQAQTQLEEAANQLRAGKLGGEAGADLLSKLNTYSATTKTDARAIQLYYAIVRKEKVGVRVPTKDVVRWLSIKTSNPNQTAHRVMEHLAGLTEEGHLIGQVECYLYRGTRVVEMQGEQDD